MIGHISHGVSEARQKGEDRWFASSASSSVFAIFDGHGGTAAAAFGAEKLAPALQALGARASDEELARAFWEADAALGPNFADGSTATVLLVEYEGESMACTLVWVGDSQGAAIDLGAAASGGDADSIMVITTPHTAECEAEVMRLEQTWAIARQMRLDKKLADEALEPAALTSAVRSTADAMGIQLSDVDAETVSKSIERGQRMDKAKYGAAKYGAADGGEGVTSLLAPRVPGGKKFVHKLLTPNATPDKIRAQPSNSKSISTAVTRALGDWDASRAMVPQPEIYRFCVAPSSCCRVVLASDGVWDFVKPHEACLRVLCREKDAQACADKLVHTAVARSKSRFNALKDDTTALVVELNPGGAAPPLSTQPGAVGGGAGCCVVS